MVVISAILAYYTWGLFKLAADQTALAKESAKEAKRSADAAENAIQFAKESSKNSDSISAINYNLSKQSLQTQVNSLAQTQKRFDAENEPYLEIKNPSLEPIKVGSKIYWNFLIANMGKAVIKMDSQSISLTRLPYREYSSFVKNPFNVVRQFKMYKSNKYINSESPYQARGTINENEGMSEEEIDAIKNKREFLFITGRIVYTNTINKKRRAYIFCIELMANDVGEPYPNTGYNFIFNENY